MSKYSILNHTFLFILFICASCSGQLKNAAATDVGQNSFRNARIDNLGNYYVISKDNQGIQKFGQGGQLDYKFTAYQYGNIASIDVTNPMKILVFYKDFSIVIILDNTLNVLREIFLLDLGFLDISAVGLSNNNNIWIYDPADFRLKKIRENGEEIFASNNLQQELTNNPNFIDLKERNNKLYALEEDGTLHIFTNQGLLLSSQQLNADNVFPTDFGYYYTVNDKLIVFDNRTAKRKEILPSLVKEARVQFIENPHWIGFDPQTKMIVKGTF